MALPLIRTATPDDFPALLAIETQSFSHPHWTADDFARHRTIVAEQGGVIAAMLVARQIFPGSGTSPQEVEILNLAVAPAHRRQGLASALLDWLFQDTADFFLEVRESNLAAQTLYRKAGFQQTGRRPGYYDNPKEAAFLFTRKAQSA